MVGAVDAGRLEHVLRQARDVVVQQEDRERQREPGVGEPHRGRRVDQIEVGEHREGLVGTRDRVVRTAHVQACQRDEGHLERDRQQRHRGDEQPLAALEVDPCEPVRGERRDRDRDDRGRDRDRHRVQQRTPQVVLGGEHGVVVLPGQLARLDGPPAGVALGVA